MKIGIAMDRRVALLCYDNLNCSKCQLCYFREWNNFRWKGQHEEFMFSSLIVMWIAMSWLLTLFACFINHQVISLQFPFPFMKQFSKEWNRNSRRNWKFPMVMFWFSVSEHENFLGFALHVLIDPARLQSSLKQNERRTETKSKATWTCTMTAFDCEDKASTLNQILLVALRFAISIFLVAESSLFETKSTFWLNSTLHWNWTM